MIEVQNLTKSYGKRLALDQLSFNIKEGQTVGFLGVNGSGKTSTMEILSGCKGADGGQVNICGFDIIKHAKEAKKILAYLPDSPPVFPELTVRQAIEFSARIHLVSEKQLSMQVDEIIDRFSLKEVSQLLIASLSKGFKQRVAFAQAIVHKPKVLLLDEPTEGLDPIQIVEIRKIIKEMGAQYTTMLSSHLLSEVENICDYIIIINKGKIVAQGHYSEILSRYGAESTCVIKVAHNFDLASRIFKETKNITKMKPSGSNSMELTIPMKCIDQTLDQLTEKLVSQQCGLRELKVNKKSLEEIFIDLNH